MARAARTTAALLLSIAVLVAATGWLYVLRPYDSLPGPRLGDALPLDELSHRGSAALVLYVAVWGAAAVLLALLARRADRDRVGVAALGEDERLHRVPRRVPPELIRGLEEGARLRHHQIRRPGRATRDDDRVEARALERRREATAEGRVEEEPRQRRFRGDARAAVARHRRVGDRPHAEDHGVLGRERARPRREPVVEKAGGEAVAAQEASRRPHVERLDARGARREVHGKDAPAVALHRRIPARPFRAAAARSAGTWGWSSSFL